MTALRCGFAESPPHDCEYEDTTVPGVPVAGIIITEGVLLRQPLLRLYLDPGRYMRPGRTYRCCQCFAYVRITHTGRPLFWD